MGFNHSYYSCLSCIFSVTLDLLLTFVQHTENPLPLGRATLFIILLHIIIFSILVIVLLTNPGSCDQDPIISVLLIHDLIECVTGISSLVTFHDIIREYGNIDKR